MFENGHWLFNARVGFEWDDGRYELTGWIKNIGDADYFPTGVATTAFGYMGLIPGLPRTYGIIATVNF